VVFPAGESMRGSGYMLAEGEKPVGGLKLTSLNDKVMPESSWLHGGQDGRSCGRGV
jgi:hypothetical protein